jgi:predicted dehydrogenase
LLPTLRLKTGGIENEIFVLATNWRTAGPMRVGLIGFGYWGKILSRYFSETQGIDLFSIADTSFERREEAGRLFPRASLASGTAEFLGNSEMDAVAIATPANTHYRIAKAALEAGKHIWVEKPVAETANQAKALLVLAQQRKLVLFIDHTFLYSGCIILIKQLLSQREYKEMRYYRSVRSNSALPRTDTSIFHDLAIHDFAILDFLFREHPLTVRVQKTPKEGSTTSGEQYIVLSYFSGLSAEIRVNWCAPAKARRIAISSHRRAIEFDDMELYHKVKLHEFPISTMANYGLSQVSAESLRERVLALHSEKDTLARAVESFLHCIRTGEKAPSDGVQGARLAAIVDSCLLSAEADGRCVNISSAM